MSGNTVVLLSILISDASPTPSAGTSEVPFKMSQSNNFLQLIGLVFILVVILAAAYYTTRFVGRISLGQFKNSNFKVIDTYRISPNKCIQIVKIGNKFIVIAVGKETINFITELDESEVLIRDVNIKENITFKQILEKLKNKEN